MKKPLNISKSIFVVQEHHAKRLHWDFRLEMNGVLVSWAIPKEPPTKAGLKRLAIQTEDHPMDWATFEGEIPEGSYGAGIVSIWDSGHYELEKKTAQKIVFTLYGSRLRGRYCLLKFKKEKEWLIFKVK